MGISDRNGRGSTAEDRQPGPPDRDLWKLDVDHPSSGERDSFHDDAWRRQFDVDVSNLYVRAEPGGKASFDAVGDDERREKSGTHE